jgi:hypothetical protein
MRRSAETPLRHSFRLWRRIFFITSEPAFGLTKMIHRISHSAAAIKKRGPAKPDLAA